MPTEPTWGASDRVKSETMLTPAEIWGDYKRLLKGSQYDQWGELWTEDGEFVVAYGQGRASFQEERHVTERTSFASFRI